MENNQSTILIVHDNWVLESIPENFSVLSPLKIKFIDGPGLGMTGPLKEFLRRILNEFRMDTKIFQGDDCDKSLVYNSENINKEKYVLVGEVMQVAIFNGFSPQFFCKDLYQVLMRGDNNDDGTGLNEPEEEPFKTSLLEIETCNLPDDCNAVLAKHDVLALVGTITYINLYQVLMRGDNNDDVTGLNEPEEEPFKNVLVEIQTCNSPDDCNAVLAKHDVFALVGTITYIINSPQKKIDTVVKDCKHGSAPAPHCAARAQTPRLRPARALNPEIRDLAVAFLILGEPRPNPSRLAEKINKYIKALLKEKNRLWV
ncbi:unnamed protein product [Bemisia tabaci]|uniref:Uncharacterized protein n=1 Tax=Bemisia tabaci TaxID=7038 RepID=A0A9P0F7E1_BEMTA|nr:unnamed protein product [Bemisia tabaci]